MEEFYKHLKILIDKRIQSKQLGKDVFGIDKYFTKMTLDEFIDDYFNKNSKIKFIK